ncbi:Transport protein particle subunit trs31 [Cyphellophora attinorum]|uniref:Trafficking protein particle complex subunit n=1 Tax=Cyphellophora attinorum TaxID=1664694 RepID=A0A0N1HIT1_9EURO|nr:Transport protein particle subunit trs31 [Phialophora attinorum]KPI36100.1 Transport protein particle subunit trs31 [Phialophora attinorum]
MAAPPVVPPSYYSQRAPTQSISSLNSPSPSANTSNLPTRPLSSSTSASTFRTPASRKTIYDRHPNRSSRTELSRSAFAFLISESIAYHQKRVTSVSDFEARLNSQGYLLGSKCLDLLLYRSTPMGSGSGTSSSSTSTSSNYSSKDANFPVRPLRILSLLNLLTTKLYPLLFSRPADSLEQSTTNKNEYMIIDNTPMTNAYISVPKELSQLSVAAWIAGVIEGVCDGAGFDAKVSAHNNGTDAWPGRTVFLLRFEEGVVSRDGELERQGVK